MTMDQFLEIYTDFLKTISEKNKSDLKALEKFTEMAEFLYPDISEKQELDQLIDEYKDTQATEVKALENFLENMNALNFTSQKQDEIRNKIKDSIEKIQAKSIEQIQEQITDE